MMLMIMIDVLSWLNAFFCVLKPSVPKTWSFVLESHITHNCTLSLGLLMWSFTMGNFESIWYKKVRRFSIKAETFDLWYHHLVQNFKKFPRMICKQVWSVSYVHTKLIGTKELRTWYIVNPQKGSIRAILHLQVAFAVSCYIFSIFRIL